MDPWNSNRFELSFKRGIDEMTSRETATTCGLFCA